MTGDAIRDSAVTVSTMGVRYRCNDCGNLTRFDVTETTTIRAFHHYSLGGELTIEEPEVLAHEIEQVTCRWCGHGRAIETLRDEAS